MSLDLAMWSRALRRMPRVTRAEWDTLDPVARWLIATRSAALVMTLFSAAIAGLRAWRDGAFDAAAWVVATAGLLLAHATNNLVNDWTDSARGVDRDDYFRARYASHLIEHGLVSRRRMAAYIVGTGLAALAVGAWCVAARGTGALALAGAGAFFVLFYTWPLKYVGLGEAAVLVVWGPLMVGGTYYVVTGAWDASAIVAGLPYALGPTSVLLGKHLDKREADRAKGIRTLPVLVGDRATRVLVLALVALQYALCAGLVVRGALSPLALVVLAALWPARLVWLAYTRPRPEAPPAEYPPNVWPAWYVAFAFHHTRWFGLLYVVGVAADAIARRLG